MSKHHFGCIDEDSMSLRYPRVIDGYAHESLAEAMKAALEMMECGTTEVAIVACTFSKRHDDWVETETILTLDRNTEANYWGDDDDT